MPNNSIAVWSGVRLPSTWADEYNETASKVGKSVARVLLEEIAKARGEEIPPMRHTNGGKVGRPRKKVTR